MKEKKTMKHNNLINIILAFSILFIGMVFVYVNIVQYKVGINADIAAEGLLAKVMWESKEWIPTEWYASTETRLITPANFASLFYGITKNICLSMGISCTIVGGVIIGSLWYLCKQIPFTKTQELLIIFLVLMLPNNRIIIELMFIHAGYYATHVALYFLTLAMYVKMLKREKVGMAEILFNLLLHFLLGIQGTRGILIITGPLLAVEFIRHIYMWWCGQREKLEDIVIGCFVFASNIVGYFGGKFSLSVKLPMSRNIRKAPLKFGEEIIPNFLNVFSWGSLSLVEKISYAVCLCLIVYLAIDIMVKGIKRKRVKEEEWIFFNFFISVILTTAALTFTTIEVANRYFVVIYFAMAIGIAILMKRDVKIVKKSLIIVIGILFVANCYRVYYPMIAEHNYEQNAHMQVGEYLLQEGYEYGYSDFANANTITVYSDGKIQVSAIDTFSEMNICKWLTSNKWYVPNVPQNSKTAYIVPDHKLNEIEEFINKNPGAVEFKTQIGHLYIYGSEYNYSKLTD